MARYYTLQEGEDYEIDYEAGCANDAELNELAQTPTQPNTNPRTRR